MNSPNVLSFSDNKSKRFTKSTDLAFEVLVYSYLGLWILSYSEFNKQELLLLIPLATFFILYILNINLLTNVNEKTIVGLMVVIFTLIFNKIDNTGLSRVIELPFLSRISLPTILLSIVTLIYLLKVMYLRNYVLELSTLAKIIGGACVLVLLMATIFYPTLYLHYQISSRSLVQLMNKMIKYFIILILFQECLKGKLMLRRISTVLLIGIFFVLLLNIVF